MGGAWVKGLDGATSLERATAHHCHQCVPSPREPLKSLKYVCYCLGTPVSCLKNLSGFRWLTALVTRARGQLPCGSSSEIALAKGVCAPWDPGRRGSKHRALRVLSGGFPTESRGPPHAGPGGQHPGNTCWGHQKQPAKENASLSSWGLQRKQGQQETCKGPRKSSHERKNSWNICQAQKA